MTPLRCSAPAYEFASFYLNNIQPVGVNETCIDISNIKYILTFYKENKSFLTPRIFAILADFVCYKVERDPPLKLTLSIMKWEGQEISVNPVARALNKEYLVNKLNIFFHKYNIFREPL